MYVAVSNGIVLMLAVFLYVKIVNNFLFSLQNGEIYETRQGCARPERTQRGQESCCREGNATN